MLEPPSPNVQLHPTVSPDDWSVKRTVRGAGPVVTSPEKPATGSADEDVVVEAVAVCVAVVVAVVVFEVSAAQAGVRIQARTTIAANSIARIRETGLFISDLFFRSFRYAMIPPAVNPD